MASNKKKPPKEAKSTALERYEIIEIRRDQIQNAPYNPRSITAKAKRRLKDNIRTVGLLSPIVWNRRTGNIVSGHQRIDCMDQIEGAHEYLIRVAAVDLDEKTEKEQNLFMNNTDVQGTFDAEGLEIIWKDGDLDWNAAGFDGAEMAHLFGETMPAEQMEAMAELSNKMHEAVKAFESAAKTSTDRNETEFYLVVVFKNNESRVEFCRRHGFDDFRYLDGNELDYVFSNPKLPEAVTDPK